MGTSAIGGPGISPVPTTMNFGAGAVSPEAILEYCSMRLNDIDGKVDKLMTQQDNANSVSTNLDAINQDLQAYTDGYHVAGVGSGNDNIGSAADKATIEGMQTDVDNHYQAAIDAANASGDSTLAATLTTAKTTFDNTTSNVANGGDDCMSAKEVSDTMDGIKNAESDSSNNSQMVMLNLQQLLSDRQQIITMASNMTQTTDDTDKAVINNIHSS
jgi:hypothetical protein